MAFLGPDTPALGEREMAGPITESQVAATVAALLGEDYDAAVPRAGTPIRDVLAVNPNATADAAGSGKDTNPAGSTFSTGIASPINASGFVLAAMREKIQPFPLD
jgi:hypothetical protein